MKIGPHVFNGKQRCTQFALRTETAIRDKNSAFLPDQSMLDFCSTARRVECHCRRPMPPSSPVLYANRPFEHQRRYTKRRTTNGAHPQFPRIRRISSSRAVRLTYTYRRFSLNLQPLRYNSRDKLIYYRFRCVYPVVKRQYRVGLVGNREFRRPISSSSPCKYARLQ